MGCGYLITYLWKKAGTTEWVYKNLVTTQDPGDWFADLLENTKKNDDEYVFHFAFAVAVETVERLKGMLG